MSAVSDFIRKSFKEGDDIRDAGLTTPEDVVRYDDILYGSDPKWQVLDVYRPKDRAGENSRSSSVSTEAAGYMGIKNGISITA